MRLHWTGTALCLAVALGGCAYAPSGTLVDALEPAGTSGYVSPGSELASAPATGSTASPSAAVDGASLPEPNAYAASGQTAVPADGRPTQAATGTQAAAAVAARAPGALLSTDQAAATRDQLLDIARARGASARGASTTTAADLLRLRETHAQDAIAEIEAAADE